MLGVTGTNGKTTVTYLARHLLAKANNRCGMIGTVEVDDGRTRHEATMTTPGVRDRRPARVDARQGVPRAAIEVSSHALDQGRVAGVGFAGAAFTNLSGDHLDYHKTMDNYAAAKARLFASLDASAVAVVNGDDKWSERVLRDCQGRVIRFGFGKAADYRASGAAYTSDGCTFTLHTPDGKAEVNLPMLGRHNVENALAAAALVGETFGLTAQQLANGLRDARTAPLAASRRCGPGSRSRCWSITPTPTTRWRTC